MAEFQVVMKQANRMCAAHEACYECPLKDHIAMCAWNRGSTSIASKCDASEVESIVMNWAAEHPEPRYPNWHRWFRETFPNSVFATSPCPNTFCRICNPNQYHGEVECYKCKSDPIPADIAEKLGIKPIGESDNG